MRPHAPAALLLLLVLVPASPARADGGAVGNVVAQADVTAWRNLSWIDLGGPAAPRRLVGLHLPRGPVTTFGGTVGGIGHFVNGPQDRLVFSLAAYASLSVGGTPTANDIADGETIHVGSGNLYIFDSRVAFGVDYGVWDGQRSTESPRQPDWRFGGALAMGAAGAWARTGFAYADGGESRGTFNARSYVWQIEGDACRRLHTSADGRPQYLCLDVRPDVFEFGFFTGITAGLRFEL